MSAAFKPLFPGLNIQVERRNLFQRWINKAFRFPCVDDLNVFIAAIAYVHTVVFLFLAEKIMKRFTVRIFTKRAVDSPG